MNDVFGNDKSFSFDKVKKCVLFEAFCEESFRLSCPVPSGPPRVSKKDIRCVKLRQIAIGQKQNPWVVDYCENKEKWSQFDKNTNKKNIEYDYILPANWGTAPNIAFCSLSDKSCWNLSDDPRELNLNYWLKKNNTTGKVTFSSNNQGRSIISFSIGKRDCLGQSLARKELQCFMANLILNYQISAQNNDCNAIKLEYDYVAVTKMKQIPVIITKR